MKAKSTRLHWFFLLSRGNIGPRRPHGPDPYGCRSDATNAGNAAGRRVHETGAEESQETDPPADSSAAAALLYVEPRRCNAGEDQEAVPRRQHRPSAVQS